MSEELQKLYRFMLSGNYIVTDCWADPFTFDKPHKIYKIRVEKKPDAPSTWGKYKNSLQNFYFIKLEEQWANTLKNFTG